MAQVMESEAALYLAFVFLAPVPQSSDTITGEESCIFQSVIDDVIKDVFKRTFGNLLKRIRKMATISEETERIVTEALKKRNYLVHEFFKAHNSAIFSEEGRKAMNADLDDIYRALNLLTFPYRDFSEYACGLADDTP
jgi:hypothetical protein